jgi:tryptophan-rich sensory protein
MDWPVFFTYLAACAAAAATGAMIKPDEWYATLNKPKWTPPSWVFPVVWTSLYILMALAVTRVAGHAQSAAFWSVQIALNTLWTPIFFGLHKMRSALVVMACLWLAVAATVISFFSVDWVAGMMLLPYLIWVSIAAALNYTVIRMNPELV